MHCPIVIGLYMPSALMVVDHSCRDANGQRTAALTVSLCPCALAEAEHSRAVLTLRMYSWGSSSHSIWSSSSKHVMGKMQLITNWWMWGFMTFQVAESATAWVRYISSKLMQRADIHSPCTTR